MTETDSEIKYIIRHFEERFGSFKGRRIALYPGEYLEEIVRVFDPVYRFYCVLEPESTQVPEGAELVILTAHREGKEPDYHRIRRSCGERGIPLMDLFGLDQIELHRELNAQNYLSIAEWKELLSGYDAVSILIPGAVARYLELQDRWVIRRRFRILYDWMVSEGKEVFFFWDTKEQAEPILTELEGVRDRLIERSGADRGFLRLAERCAGKRVIHIGIGTVKDGIVPREYGLDSRMFRYFTGEVSIAGRADWFRADKTQLMEEIGRHGIISFDIFDTLLKRTVLHPKDVFAIAEERTGIRGFADLRYEIQTECPQFSLDEIYACLKERGGYDEQTAETLRRTELQIENDVILPRRAMIEMYDYAKGLGKTVVLVSDMYLDPAFLRELLEKNGITGYRTLYVSCQYGKLKQEGLFEEIARDFLPEEGTARDREQGVEPGGGAVLHIGDDRYSDDLSAREFGLDAYYVPGCLELAVKNGYEEAVKQCGTLADRKLLGLGIALGFDDPFAPNSDALIADLVVAPLAMSYLQWVCGKLADRDYDAFLLFSRDGWILLDTYERLRQTYPGALPPGKYFYTSRRAALLTDTGDPERACDAEQYRKNYRDYLAREGLVGKKCAAMDFISEGSSQRTLEKNVACAMDGYYVGVPEYVSEYARNIRYFLDRDLTDYDTEMRIEVYFTSPEPALDHIGAGGQPVFAAEVRDRKVLERIGRIHARVRDYLDRYLDSLYDPGDRFGKDPVFELCKSVNQYDVENFYYDDLSGRIIGAKQ